MDPTATFSRTDEREPPDAGALTSGDPSAELGLSGRWSFTSSLTLNGTVNPDFSQVEADVAQLDVNQRFALFYPEKRPFFLEGIDYFVTPIQSVFSRTVADPYYGVKVTGKNEAFFSVRTVQDAPLSYRAQRAYGEVLFGLRQDSLALAAYRRALELAPTGFGWRVRNDLARRFRVMATAGPEAEQLEASLAERPDQEDTRGYLIAALLVLGRYKEAAMQADSALARGANAAAFKRIRALADSADRAQAPAGSRCELASPRR